MPYFERFDILEAHLAYADEWHSGQWSELYARSCRIRKYYTPSLTWCGYDSLTENGKEIYDLLVNARSSRMYSLR
jgi:hypothetical protein